MLFTVPEIWQDGTNRGGPGIKMIKLEQLPLLSNRTMDCLKMQEMYEESSRRNT